MLLLRLEKTSRIKCNQWTLLLFCTELYTKSLSSTPVFSLCTKSEIGYSGQVLCQDVLFSSELLFRWEKQLWLRIHYPLHCLKTQKKCRML